MSHDIVARLRFYKMQFRRACTPGALTTVEPEFMTQLCGDWETAADEIERLRSERDEAIIRSNAVIREASSLITAKIPSGKASAYWNAVDNFRRFESKTT